MDPSATRFVACTDGPWAVLDCRTLRGEPLDAHAALVPIRKSAAWWAMAQDERERIFRVASRHGGIGLRTPRTSRGGFSIAAISRNPSIS